MPLFGTWLLCSVAVLSNFSFTFAQLPTTIATDTMHTASQASPAPTAGESNGIISDTGTPTDMATLSFSIMSASTTPSGSQISSSSTQLAGSSSNQKHTGLELPAILGIALGIALLVIAIMALAVWVYMRRRQQLARMKRKTIMDAEFAESKPSLGMILEKPLPKVAGVQKPLPAVTQEDPDHRLSSSSTIIAADAAEIAQINRKASMHQGRPGKTFRERLRERERTLTILQTNENRRDSNATALNSNPATPTAACHDNNGDVFEHRPSRI